ncbi:NUDIX domain-containing protein [Paenibacillus sp. SN-8-1]|uniref:NUDIX domain-containing protein n=1 Tax=Paenibacillus sp. SN-8-1 TaxID=3435409 RepID=UPI003D9A1D1F
MCKPKTTELRCLLSHIRVRPTALIIKNNSILLVEYCENGTHYNLPGGGAEPGETLIESIKREAYEEACIEIEVGPVALIYEFAPHKQSGDYGSNAQHGLNIIFECTIKEGAIPRLPDKPDPHQTAVKWVDLNELDSIILFPNIKDEIKEYVKTKRNIDIIEDYKLKPVLEENYMWLNL